jgi:hypothetical protein
MVYKALVRERREVNHETFKRTNLLLERMELADIAMEGRVGLYRVTGEEQETLRQLFGIDLLRLNRKSGLKSDFTALLHNVLPSFPPQRTQGWSDVHRRNDKLLVGDLPSMEYGKVPRGITVCVELPSTLDRSDVPRPGWARTKYKYGTLLLMEGPSPDLYGATLDISISYGVCGQHETTHVHQTYKKDVVDDIVDAVTESELGLSSPICKGRNAFVPAFLRYGELAAVYEQAKAMVPEGGSEQRATLDALRSNALTCRDKEQQVGYQREYEAALTELIVQ